MQRSRTLVVAILMATACVTTTTSLQGRRNHRLMMNENKPKPANKEDEDAAAAEAEKYDNDEQITMVAPEGEDSEKKKNKNKKKNTIQNDCICPSLEIPFEEYVANAECLMRVQIQDVPKQTDSGAGTYFAKVVESFKGKAERTIKVNVDNNCNDNNFAMGKQYIISAEQVRPGKYRVAPCSRSTKWNKLGKAEKLLLQRADTVVKTPATDPLPANIRVVDERTVMESYESCTLLRKDLTQVLRFYASNIIIGKDFCRYKPGGELTPFAVDTERQNARSSDGLFTPFETSNQIAATEQADIVKYDEWHVYLAYGDTLVVWDKRRGNETIRVVMPSPEEVVKEECGTLGLDVTDAGAPQFCFAGESRAVIEGILLQQDRLVLIVSGYTVHFSSREGKPSILSDYGASTVRMYDTSQLEKTGNLPLVARTELQGRYKEGRTIGSMAHIATTLRVNIGAHLDSELDTSKFPGMVRDAYRTAAIAKAEALIPEIVRQIIYDLNTGNKCQSVARLAAFMKSDVFGDAGLSDEARCNLQDTISFQTLVKVTSFNVQEELNTDEDKKVAKLSTGASAAFFSKEGPAIVTTSNNRMIFTADGYHWNETEWSTRSFTYILTFLLPSDDENLEAVPSTFGFVEGHPVTEFAINEYRGNLRIATTKIDDYSCADIVTVDGELRCAGRESYEPESQVIILRYSNDGGSMEEIGRVEDLGEGWELRAILFDGDTAFASTFGNDEPFHSLDLSDPSNPLRAGSLEVSGVSTYLHMVEEGMFVLGVGEVTDDLGFPMGLAVSLFDVFDLENPRLAARYEFEDEAGGFILSDALFDPKSLRLLEGQQKLILPLKIDDSGAGELIDGFAILQIDMDEETITYEFMVNHTEYTQTDSCFSPAYVPSRSIVSTGRLITMKGHAVVSTGLDSQKERYRIDLDAQRVAECNGYFP